jgi:hypothetical protein
MGTADADGPHLLPALVRGLRSGEADLDLDGLVSLDELYRYLHDQSTSADPSWVPMQTSQLTGEVHVARRGTPVSIPAPLPPQLHDVLRAGEVWERRGAVARLHELLAGGHPGRALAARIELERLADDPSDRVRRDAREALSHPIEPDPMPASDSYDVAAASAASALQDVETESEPEPVTPRDRVATPPATVGSATQDAITSAVSTYVSEGRLLFNPPHQMRLGRTERVAVALSQRPGLDAELRQLAGAEPSTPTEAVETSPFMEVELKGPAFDITPLHVGGGSEQMLRPLALWQYDVTPQRRGSHGLHLCVAMRIPLPGRPDERVSIPVLERRVVITVDVRYAVVHFVRSHWQWLVATVSGLAGAILAWVKLIQG